MKTLNIEIFFIIPFVETCNTLTYPVIYTHTIINDVLVNFKIIQDLATCIV